ncbi:MAG: DUF362 domain-containing protein [Thermoplasmatota archaeon]
MHRLDETDTCQVCIQNSSYDDLCLDALLKPLGGINAFVDKGDRVCLKVNLLNASPPEKGVCTHPEIVRAVAKQVLAVGGVPFIADSPSGPFTKRRLERVYRKSGMESVASDLGISLNYDTSTTQVDIGDGRRLSNTVVCNYFLTADKTISLPKLKTHSFMGLTLACKNMYGVIPGLKKARYHSTHLKRKYFADMLVDVLSVATADLVILDGIVAMQGDGPSGGELVDVGVVFASDHDVGLDISVCRMFGFEAVGIPVLKQAKIRGLWPREIQYPLLSPSDVSFRGFLLPSTMGHLVTGKKKPKRHPVVNKSCVLCGNCEEICPRDAINSDSGLVVIDYSKCILCYCCHEVCPYNAIDLQVIKV